MTPSLPEHLVAPIKHYLELLEHWNQRHALTALPPSQRWEELILDSSVLLPALALLPSSARVVDMGTGMGIPALLLALARPDLHVLAIDKARKKILFLRQALLELEMDNLEAIHGRLEDLPPLAGDLGVSKATASMGQLLGWWDRHARPGASFLALKSVAWVREGEIPGWRLRGETYELPTRGSRVLVHAVQEPGPHRGDPGIGA